MIEDVVEEHQASFFNEIFMLGIDSTCKDSVVKSISNCSGMNRSRLQSSLPLITKYGKGYRKRYQFNGLFIQTRKKQLTNNISFPTRFWEAAGSGRQFVQAVKGPLGKCAAVIFVQNVANPSYLEHIENSWIPIALQNIPKQTPMFLLGIHKKEDQQNLTTKKAEIIAEKYGMNWKQVKHFYVGAVTLILDHFVRQIVKRQNLSVRPKDLFMALLCHLNEDFDDDLLQDAIEMLVTE